MKFPHFGKSSGTEAKRPGEFGTLMINDSPLDHSEVFSLLNSQYPEKRETQCVNDTGRRTEKRIVARCIIWGKKMIFYVIQFIAVHSKNCATVVFFFL